MSFCVVAGPGLLKDNDFLPLGLRLVLSHLHASGRLETLSLLQENGASAVSKSQMQSEIGGPAST